ncbi:MAG TPA: fluoride efflux transporter CrcB [Phaeodactylibacter sp.]|nr:fluoride efflux transporter CrcB [Phaeodactylibacter sp.]
MNFLLVFIGGGLGSISRFGISVLLKNHGYTLPLATFFANAISCIVLGVLVGWTIKSGQASDIQKYMLITGFCGGFSTFSTFSNETFQLFQSGNVATAFGYVLLSLVVGLFCIYLGMKMGQTI